MSAIYLTSCTDFFLIRWIANLLGIIMNLLYNFFDLMNIANIGLCIIVFTFIIKMLMLPLTIKQQKFTKLSSIMSPELQAIQKKYRGKSDQESMMKMQEETRAVYAKYGVSQTGGCIQMLIQMPILFALYAVISCMPNYVNDVQKLYTNDNTGIVDIVYNDASDINNLDSIYKLVIDYDSKKDNDEFKYDYSGINKYLSNFKDLYDSEKKEDVKKQIYDYLVSVNYSENHLNMVDDMYKQIIELTGNLENVTNEEWDKIIAGLKEKKDAATDENESTSYNNKINLVEKYRELSFTSLKNKLSASKDSIENSKSEIKNIYSFLGIDLSKSPKNGVKWALLIPILSALTQWLSMKISTSAQGNSSDNPMASSMKVMNITMPLISAFFCFSLPSGLGLYWVATSVFQILQQLVINSYFKKVEVEKIIEENIKKANKKKAKKGIPEGNTISNAAKSNTRNINYTNPVVEKNGEDIDEIEKNSDTKPKGKISSRANMVKEFNERNKQ